jgi:Tfp pilus assembly protein PilO
MILNSYKKINIPKKIFIAVIGFLVIIFIIFHFFIAPTLNDIKKLSNDIIFQKIDLENKLINEKKLISLNEKILKIEPQLEKLDQIYINKNRDLEFITTMEGMAEKNSMNQKIIFDPSTGVVEQDYKKVLLNFELNGNYFNFLKYLNDLETLPYYINIFNIEASIGNSNLNQANDHAFNSKNNINIVMSANTFWK